MPAEGYQPIVDYDHWRVAILRYCAELEIHHLQTMQKHDETDEVFVLLDGQCILFSGVGQIVPADITALKMEPLKIYNIKRGVWHTHTLDQQGCVLIVENRNTNDDNSPTTVLTRAQLSILHDQYRTVTESHA